MMTRTRYYSLPLGMVLTRSQQRIRDRRRSFVCFCESCDGFSTCVTCRRCGDKTVAHPCAFREPADKRCAELRGVKLFVSDMVKAGILTAAAPLQCPACRTMMKCRQHLRGHIAAEPACDMICPRRDWHDGVGEPCGECGGHGFHTNRCRRNPLRQEQEQLRSAP